LGEGAASPLIISCRVLGNTVRSPSRVWGGDDVGFGGFDLPLAAGLALLAVYTKPTVEYL